MNGHCCAFCSSVDRASLVSIQLTCIILSTHHNARSVREHTGLMQQFRYTMLLGEKRPRSCHVSVSYHDVLHLAPNRAFHGGR